MLVSLVYFVLIKMNKEQKENLRDIVDCAVWDVLAVGSDRYCGDEAEVAIGKLQKLFATALEEQRQADANTVRTHLLTDWSGETEVYEELEKIAKKIESTILNGKETE
ncbi:MAG: hypothetical protein NUV65_03565 [Candidatus Roizmanbacteria bacterium]|nr:hypothetical protein [Candidatus Roizmanbacteria bacterium]